MATFSYLVFDMKEYKFEDKKLYRFDGGCLYVIKRKKRSMRGVLLHRCSEVYLGDETFKATLDTAVELDFKIETAIMIKPERYNAEYVEVMGHTICSYCITDKYKCPLLFTGISRYRLKELFNAGVKFGGIYIDTDL